jgi:hypothetical protein
MTKSTTPGAAVSSLRDLVKGFRSLLEQGKTLELIEQFYAEDVCVFENRELARAGREKCLAYERKALAKQPRPPEIHVRSSAVDEAAGVSFFELVLRFIGPDGRPARLEEVAVQKWHAGKISEERFYYEGIVDEGD